MNQLIERIKDELFDFVDSLHVDLHPFTDGLEERFGISTYDFYIYSFEHDDFRELSSEDLKTYKSILKTFGRDCDCEQHTSYKQNMNLEFEFLQASFGADCEDEAEDLPEIDRIIEHPTEPNGTDDMSLDHKAEASEMSDIFGVSGALGEKLCAVMMRVHGLDYITNVPRMGSHFIQGWAAPFSKDWYAASFLSTIFKLYDEIEEIEDGSISKVMNSVYHLGRSVSEVLWREKHFKNASAGYLQSESLIAATRSMKGKAKSRTRNKLNCIKALLDLVCVENAECRRFDAIAAVAIHEHLLLHQGNTAYRPLIVKSSGGPIGQDAIRRHLRTLRNLGRI